VFHSIKGHIENKKANEDDAALWLALYVCFSPAIKDLALFFSFFFRERDEQLKCVTLMMFFGCKIKALT
jgi:hypothetical protein